ncbi:thioredoxin [bacterium]|nr:thioredoxin [bacterium]
MSKLEFINNSNFEEKVLKSGIPVLIDFYADWCAPCKMMEPAVEAFADAYIQKVSVFKLNVDENPMIAAQFHIMSIPTMLVFKNGKPVTSIIGAVSLKKLVEKMKPILED